MLDLIEMADAIKAREEGMTRAADHAERVEPGWNDEAYSFLLSFARTHETFISEDVSDAHIAAGYQQPPTLRAWGSVYRRAAKADIIIQTGAGRSRRRHASMCPKWTSCIYRRAS